MPDCLKSNGPHVWDKPDLSVGLVCLVCLVCLVFWLNETNQMNQINQINKTNQINQTDRTDQMNKTGCRTVYVSRTNSSVPVDGLARNSARRDVACFGGLTRCEREDVV